MSFCKPCMLVLIVCSMTGFATVSHSSDCHRFPEWQCEIPNGSGHQVCVIDANGNASYSECLVVNCDAGFEPVGTYSCERAGGLPPPQGVAEMGGPYDEKVEEPAPKKAEEVAEVSAEQLKEKLKQIAEKNEGKQESSRADAKKMYELAGNQAATVGAIYCAEGANAGANNAALNAADLAACVSYFESAEAMNKMAGKTGFDTDPAISGSEKGQEILGEFEKNFGVSKEDYLASMLKGGKPDARLSELLGDMIGDEKLAESFAEAQNAAKSSDLSWDLAGKKADVKSNLRDKLKDQLAKNEKATKRNLASSAAAKPAGKSDESKLDNLSPFSAEEVFGTLEEREQELSIFDVVRRKYVEVSRRLSMVPRAK